MSILVIRLSSLGDVALTIPVFKTLEQQLPNQKFYFLTKSAYKDLFFDCKNVSVIPVDLNNKYSGIKGLKTLANDLLKYRFSKVIDLHDVLRTKVVRSILQLNGKEVHVFKKGRKEKKAALIDPSKLENLPHTTKRYLDAFNFLDFEGRLINGPWLLNSANEQFSENYNTIHKKSDTRKWIGIAPFSKHRSKEWSLEKVQKLISKSIEKYNAKIFLFAFGNEEKQKAASILASHPNVILIDESVSLKEQLHIIKQIDAMISMDSGNMHLASIIGIKVISVWISTHPNIGFSPLENEALVVTPKHINWEPLSIYGKMKSKNLALIEQANEAIKVEHVLTKLAKVLSK